MTPEMMAAWSEWQPAARVRELERELAAERRGALFLSGEVERAWRDGIAEGRRQQVKPNVLDDLRRIAVGLVALVALAGLVWSTASAFSNLALLVVAVLVGPWLLLSAWGIGYVVLDQRRRKSRQ